MPPSSAASCPSMPRAMWSASTPVVRPDRYLGDTIAPFFNAIDPVFIPHYLPRWQVKLSFRLYPCDPYILGTMNVDATTGQPIPLTQHQLDHIHERAQAFLASDPHSQPQHPPIPPLRNF